MKKKDDLADFFKDKFDSFEPQVPANAWNGIKTGLNNSAGLGSAASSMGVSLTTKIVATLITIGALAAIGVVMLPENVEVAEQNVPTTAEVEQNTPWDEPVKLENPTAVVFENVAKAEVIEDARIQKSTNTEHSKVTTSNSNTEAQRIPHETHAEVAPEIESTSNAIVQNKVVEQLAKEEVLEVEQYIPSIIADQNGNNPNSFQFYGVEKLARVKWQFGDGKESTDLSPIHTYDAPGEYVVTLLGITNSGQSVLDKAKVVIKPKSEEPVKSYTIKIPNVITPDGDGINDVLVIEHQNVSEAVLSIYQVNGQLVYTSDDISKPWKGLDNKGEQLNKATYFYVIKIIDAQMQTHVEKGYITIF